MDKKRAIIIAVFAFIMTATLTYAVSVSEKHSEEAVESVSEKVTEAVTESSKAAPGSASVVYSEEPKAVTTFAFVNENYKVPSEPYIGSLNFSLETCIKAKRLGLCYSEARLHVSQQSDEEKFDGLISGKNDMIFTTGLTEDQKKAAEKAGVKLISVPVAKEGLIFTVNSNNPVDSLTSGQIRDIYEGKITNWKQIGGNDEVILPYQKNEYADSFKSMEDFMNGRKLAEPLKIIDIVTLVNAVYDNAENAIGYSVYSRAARIFEKSSDIKYIAVDGVKPTAETMNNGTYPVVSTFSMVYTEDASQETKDLAAWILSDEGQEAVLDGGFIPVNDTEYPDDMEPYYSKGTGAEKPADHTVPEKSDVFVAPNGYEEWKGELPYSECVMTGLKDTELQDQINADIKNTVFGGEDVISGNWTKRMRLCNGYLNICFVNKRYPYEGNINDFSYEDYINLNYDLVNRKRIEHFSDLFFKDEEFVTVINKRIAEYLNQSEDLRSDYLGMIGDITNFGFDQIVLDKSKTYTDEIMVIDFHSMHDTFDLFGSMALSAYFDNKEVIDEENFSLWRRESRHSEGYSPDWVKEFSYGKDGKLHYDFFSRSHTASEAEERNRVFESLYEKSVRLYAEEFPETADKIRPDSDAYIEDPETNSFWVGINAFSVSVSGGEGCPYRYYYFDPETEEQFLISDVMGEDYEKYDNEYYFAGIGIGEESGKLHLYRNVGQNSPDTVEIEFKPDSIRESKYIVKLIFSLF